MSGTIRLSDVAKAAGVSLGTASNTFNRPDRVRAEVRELVETAARKLGYSGPNPKGRLLMGGKVNAIGVVFRDWLASFFDDPARRDFLAGVAEACDAAGVGVALISAKTETSQWRVGSAVVDGFIVNCLEGTESIIEIAQTRNLPLVVVDIEVPAHINSIRIDDRGGAREAARHLLKLGHRRFAILAIDLAKERQLQLLTAEQVRTNSNYEFVRQRLEGYADGLSEAGVSIDAVPILGSTYESTGTKAAASRILDLAPDATAVLAMSDSLALPVIAEAQKRGLVVPRDLSVVGYDDVADADKATPPLTTVAQPIVEKGRRAAQLILGGGPPQHIVLPVKLIVRGSTAPPRR
jgi:DNA-binding LacI/PurR family transcriptional regulator